jgi:hypothetical protein
MSARSRAAHRLAWLVFAAVTAVAVPGVHASDALLYRIFLRDGSTLVSYGDFARVADRVVFSIPIGGVEGASPVLHLVSINESVVDWTRTDEYAAAARARRHAETRGEADFDQLSTQLARILSEVTKARNPADRLAIANVASRMLANWPATHYGYRASDVAQLSAMLDGVVSDLRVAAGQTRFDLSLVATSNALPPNVELLPPPTLRESVEQVFKVASVTPEPAERISLLESIRETLKQPAADTAWAAALSAKASAVLLAEQKADREYQDLVTRTMAASTERAQRADVNGIEALVRAVLKADDRLGRKRPQTTAALLATLDAKLDGARRLRLARDAWSIRQRAFREYQQRLRSPIERFRQATMGLEQIRQLAGPSPQSLPRLASRLSDAWRELKLIKPPAEAEEAHSLFVSALQMAIRAATSRQMAITSTDITVAWEASSAAAGALLLYERAQEGLQKLNTVPSL